MISDTDPKPIVVTHSSGNHAQAAALAARWSGIPAHIVMPSNSSKVKVAAVKGYGGRKNGITWILTYVCIINRLSWQFVVAWDK